MKKSLIPCILMCLLLLPGCAPSAPVAQTQRDVISVVATTYPTYCIATAVVEEAQTENIEVRLMISEPTSCLHDYTLTTADMKLLESADVILISGAGLEPFLDGTPPQGVTGTIVDCSDQAALMEDDPHYWLDPMNAAAMARTIGTALGYDADGVAAELEAMVESGRATLRDASCRELITFHDGFAYLANALDLTILRAIEEEDGATASARELAEIAALVQSHRLPAIFTETYGLTASAEVITRETGVPHYPLSTMLSPLESGQEAGLAGYRAVFNYNISTLSEALK